MDVRNWAAAKFGATLVVAAVDYVLKGYNSYVGPVALMEGVESLSAHTVCGPPTCIGIRSRQTKLMPSTR